MRSNATYVKFYIVLEVLKHRQLKYDMASWTLTDVLLIQLFCAISRDQTQRMTQTYKSINAMRPGKEQNKEKMGAGVAEIEEGTGQQERRADIHQTRRSL